MKRLVKREITDSKYKRLELEKITIYLKTVMIKGPTKYLKKGALKIQIDKCTEKQIEKQKCTNIIKYI